MKEFVKPEPANERAKRGILVAMLGLTVLSTAGLWLASNNEQLYGAVTMFSAVAYAVGALIWCQIDSVERGIPLGTGFRIAVILIALIALPYYLFKSRGLKEGSISLGFGFVFYLLLILVASITNLILSISDGTLNILK